MDEANYPVSDGESIELTEEKEKNFTPILPYDISFSENFSMYDNTIYYNNRDVTTQHLLEMETGNIVKYFTFTLSEEPCIIKSEK